MCQSNGIALSENSYEWVAKEGNPKAFVLSKPHIPGFDYSFSGLKTSFYIY